MQVAALLQFNDYEMQSLLQCRCRFCHSFETQHLFSLTLPCNPLAATPTIER